MIGGGGDRLYYGRDNIAVDRLGNDLPMFGRYGVTRAQIREQDAPLHDLEGFDILETVDVETVLLATSGARPWDRSEMEIRVLFYIAEGRGEVIDSEAEVGGYPTFESTRAPFVESDWDLTTMRPRSGVWPGQKEGAQEHLSPRDREMRATNR